MADCDCDCDCGCDCDCDCDCEFAGTGTLVASPGFDGIPYATLRAPINTAFAQVQRGPAAALVAHAQRLADTVYAAMPGPIAVLVRQLRHRFGIIPAHDSSFGFVSSHTRRVACSAQCPMPTLIGCGC